jgi:PAS domain S-box-containing protein
MAASDALPPKPVELERVALTEENFRLLVESVQDYGIFILDATGTIRSWNEGAERLKGYTAAEAIGQNFSIFYTPEDRARSHPQNELMIAAREGRYEEEGWRVRKDGSRFWANVIITRLKTVEGGPLGFAKVTRDLTERKANEDALLASQEQTRLFYENVKDYAFITLDLRGHVVDWNEGARRIKGYEANEILGKHFSVFYDPDEIRMGRCEYELREAATTGRFEDEGWRLRKDGTKFWANVVITALYDRQRRLQGYSKVTRDVTERKRAEARLKMANESLERRVQERTLELTSTNETLLNEVKERERVERELQGAIRTRDEFLSIASHELKTPITPLKLQLHGIMAYLRQGKLAELPPERLGKMTETLDRSLNRLIKLIDSLLDVARINAGKIELHPEPLDAGEVLRETCARLEYEATMSGSELTCEIEGPLDVFLDRLRMEQVITNLVMNAIKYGNSQPITVMAARQGDRLVLQIRDQGLGIALVDQARIFERFERASKHAGSGGLGLGLYIVKQITDAQGGAIKVQSEPGYGATFTVELPLQSAGTPSQS